MSDSLEVWLDVDFLDEMVRVGKQTPRAFFAPAIADLRLLMETYKSLINRDN